MECLYWIMAILSVATFIAAIFIIGVQRGHKAPVRAREDVP